MFQFLIVFMLNQTLLVVIMQKIWGQNLAVLRLVQICMQQQLSVHLQQFLIMNHYQFVHMSLQMLQICVLYQHFLKNSRGGKNRGITDPSHVTASLGCGDRFSNTMGS
eukprot:UN08207